MKIVNVDSSFIESLGWENMSLTVWMKSGCYVYEGVPESVFNEMVVAESIGKYLNANIKNSYSYVRVG